MSNRIEIHEGDLNKVSGGQITYTWDGKSGSLGINGRNPYILLDKEAFLDFYYEHKETMNEADIIRNLREMGIIKKP